MLLVHRLKGEHVAFEDKVTVLCARAKRIHDHPQLAFALNLLLFLRADVQMMLKNLSVAILCLKSETGQTYSGNQATAN